LKLKWAGWEAGEFRRRNVRRVRARSPERLIVAISYADLSVTHTTQHTCERVKDMFAAKGRQPVAHTLSPSFGLVALSRVLLSVFVLLSLPTSDASNFPKETDELPKKTG